MKDPLWAEYNPSHPEISYRDLISSLGRRKGGLKGDHTLTTEFKGGQSGKFDAKTTFHLLGGQTYHETLTNLR